MENVCSATLFDLGRLFKPGIDALQARIAVILI